MNRVLLGVVGAVIALQQIGCYAEPVEVPRELTAAELADMCKPKVDAANDELGKVQTRVAELERTAAEKEGKVRELEEKMARNAEAGKSQREELNRLKAELAQTKEQLVIAEQEKDRLLSDLRLTQEELSMTKEELVETTKERDVAREDALANRWTAFMNDAQLEICEKGNRKKMGNCREVVQATLGAANRRDKFSHCIRSGQAQPMVHEMAKGASLPQYSEMIDEEQKQVQGWYVEYCDPTLPEKEDVPLSDAHLPATEPAAAPAAPAATGAAGEG